MVLAIYFSENKIEYLITMDRIIPQEEINRVKRLRLIKVGGIIAAIVVTLILISSAFRSRVYRKDLSIGIVTKGVIESTVSASGKVIPALEERINSPISTRIIEVFHHEGEQLKAGTPLMRLDLQSTESELIKLRDEGAKRQLAIENLKLSNSTSLSNLEMQIKVKEMEVSRLKVELENERYLDSLGSGTGDRVHQVELSYNTGSLQLEQLYQQLANERKVKDSEIKAMELDMNIFMKDMEEMSRKMQDAQVTMPHDGTLTYVNNNIGQQISMGEHIATIANLNHFSIIGNIADSYADRVSVGNRATVKIGKTTIEGTINTVTPISKDGVISFTVKLDDDQNISLRSGVRTDVYVKGSILDDVIRIPNGSYYIGPAVYNMFVVEGDKLVQRNVTLGGSNWEYVEVVSGLSLGEEVVTSDMKEYINNKTLKLN